MLTNDIHAAEIIIINTCAFIAEATRESIDTILEYAALKRSGSCRALIVCGCLPQRYRAELAAELPEVDLFLGSSEYARIAEHIEELQPAPGNQSSNDYRQTGFSAIRAHTALAFSARLHRPILK